MASAFEYNVILAYSDIVYTIQGCAVQLHNLDALNLCLALSIVLLEVFSEIAILVLNNDQTTVTNGHHNKSMEEVDNLPYVTDGNLL